MEELARAVMEALGTAMFLGGVSLVAYDIMTDLWEGFTEWVRRKR